MPSNLATNGYNLLFVYGTLRRGSSHHHILQAIHARYLEPAIVAAELFDLGRFPGARLIKPTNPGVGNRLVTGELYRLQNSTPDLDVLDRYEGLQPLAVETPLFRRELARVRTRGGKTMQAWIYALARRPAAGRLILSGDDANVPRG
jgi:gamma-glutamylcyclotransferase (GGCT)/AIG2-like uncharacterized protein YtfP